MAEIDKFGESLKQKEIIKPEKELTLKGILNPGKRKKILPLYRTVRNVNKVSFPLQSVGLKFYINWTESFSQ